VAPPHPKSAARTRLPAGAEYHEGIAANWTAAYGRRGFRQRLALFHEVIGRNVQTGQQWMDLGCGSGVLTKELLGRGARVTAVDGSPGMLRCAEDYLGSDANKVVWLEGDVAQVDVAGYGRFDGLLCSSVIEYVDDPHALMEKIAGVLSPAGLLIISMPPRYSIIRMLQKVLRRAASLAGRDVCRYLSVSRFEIDPASLRQWLGRYGFELLVVSRFDPVLPRAVWSWFRPALLVCEARKLEAAKQ
jgi:2-polyprenyl-3-methyl-5-hydroxy-6-metoxy-1,4-benzoquinol methylase